MYFTYVLCQGVIEMCVDMGVGGQPGGAGLSEPKTGRDMILVGITGHVLSSCWVHLNLCETCLDNCMPRTNVHRGYYGLVVFTQRPQTFHRSQDNLKNPYRIAFHILYVD